MYTMIKYKHLSFKLSFYSIIYIPPSLTLLDATLMTSVAMAFGEYLSLDVATTGNWYSTKYVLKTGKKFFNRFTTREIIVCLRDNALVVRYVYAENLKATKRLAVLILEKKVWSFFAAAGQRN